MPETEKRGRGKVLRTRTVKAGKDKYMRCDVMEKAGPSGGRTVCSAPKKKKTNSPSKRRRTGY